jgi:AcrR family transcriptional regulator
LKIGRTVSKVVDMAATPLRERTRHEIQHEAMALFARKGYDATSLQDIANAVGCSKATVLYHFSGKPAVLAAVLEPSATALAALVSEAAQLSPAAAQLHAINGFADLAVRGRGLISVLNDVMPTMGEMPEFDGLIAAGEQLTRLLAGSENPLDIGLAEFAIHGLLGECRGSEQRTDDDLRELCITAMRRLLSPPA